MSSKENEQLIVSEFKGLNTTSTPDSMPLGDAAHLVNVLPDIGGGLRKRPGSRTLYRDNFGRYGVSLASVTTSRGYKYLVSKEGTAIRVYLSVQGGGLWKVVQKNNVFSSVATRIRAQMTVLNDTPTRVLMLTGVNKPVQLQIVELLETASVAGTSITLRNVPQANGVGVGSMLVYVNGNVYTASTLSASFSIPAGSKGELVLSGFTGLSVGDRVEVALFTWQWWAEAWQWFGDRFYKASPRLHVEASTDVNVPIPESIRSDLNIDPNPNPAYPIVIYPSATSVGAPRTFVSTLSPSTSSEYSWGDGSPYTPGASARTTPTPFFATFGAIIAASQATSEHIFRRRPLRFNGVRQSIDQTNLAVYLNNTSPSVANATAYGSYTYYDAAMTASTNPAAFLSFESGTIMGLPSTTVVQAINTERTHIGSAATTNYWKLEGANFDGAYVPIAGLGAIADFYRGYYPTTATLFRNRLCLGGFKHLPQAVMVSAVFDYRSSIAYSFFQISEDYVLATDPIDIRLPSGFDEQITGLVSWQDSLFALTTNGVYRIYGGDAPSLDRANVGVSLMNRVGCVNPFSIAVSETGVYYLSTQGLFTLGARDNQRDQYDSVSASLKINNIWEFLKESPNVSWLSYDNNTKLLYVGLPERNLPQDYALKLMVFHVQLSEWTEFYTHGHFRIYHMIFHNGSTIFAASTQNSVEINTPENFVLARFEDNDYNLDFAETWTSTGTSDPFYAAPPMGVVRLNAVAGVREYPTEGSKTGQLQGFKLSPIRTLRDVRVYTETAAGVQAELVFGVSEDDPGAQFIKLPNGNIYLLQNPPSGGFVGMVPRFII